MMARMVDFIGPSLQTACCPICKESLMGSVSLVGEIGDNDEAINHIFHRTCLGSWLSHNSFCPMCRRQIINAQDFSSISDDSSHEIEESARQRMLIERMLAAIERGDLEAVRFLLPPGTNIPENLRGRAVVSAACCISSHASDRAIVQNCHEIIRFLLSGEASISDDARGAAVSVCAERGVLETVRFLLPPGTNIPENLRGRAVVKAAYCIGSHEIIRFLLSGESSISDDDRGIAVSGCAGRGDLETVRFLLPPGANIPEACRVNAVRAAAGCFELHANDSVIIQNCHEILRFLLSGGSSISDDIRGQVVAILAGIGDLETVRFLLPPGANIPEACRVSAGQNAVLCSDMHASDRDIVQKCHEIIRFLLSGEAPISDDIRGEVVSVFARIGDLETVRFLLPPGANISEFYRLNAVRAAAVCFELHANDSVIIQNCHEILRFLLSGGSSISDDIRGRVVSMCAQVGHLETVRFLLPPGANISFADKTIAARAAAFCAANDSVLEQNCHEIIRFLFPSDETRGDVVAMCAGEGDLEAVRFLLPPGVNIPGDCRESAVLEAVDCISHHANDRVIVLKCHEIIRFLLSEGALISDYCRGEVVSVFARIGDLETVRFLLPPGANISEDLRGRAVLEATACIGRHANDRFMVMKCHGIIRFLLSGEASISDEMRDVVVSNFARMGELETARALLHISDDRTVIQRIFHRVRDLFRRYF